jgi:hypothetical protein
MNRIVEPARVGARGTDSVTLIDTATRAANLKASDVDFVLQYLGSVTSSVIDNILGQGMAFMPVTYADRFDGPTTVAELTSIGCPKGCSVFLDVESLAPSMNTTALMLSIDDWATAVQAAGYLAMMYAGANALLTSQELWDRKVTGYWKSLSRVTDRNGLLAEPECGWMMHQLYPSVMRGGVWSDINFIQQDYRGRVPAWVRASPAAAQAGSIDTASGSE